MAAPDRIRNIAVGLVVRGEKALVEIYEASERQPRFARAIGGGIEFGETASEAIVREFSEELGIDLSRAEQLAVTENIFDAAGMRGHEIVHVFAVGSAALDALPDDVELRVLDSTTTVRWVSLADIRRDHPPLYPVGMRRLLDELARNAPRPSLQGP